MQGYWSLILEDLKKKISSSNYQAWFSRIKFVSTNNQGRKITISSPSNFNKQYIEKKFQKELRDSINKYYPKVIHIEYKIEKEEIVEPIQESLDLPKIEERGFENSNEDSKSTEPEKISSYLPRKNLNNLNPKYTFENFVVTRSSEFVANVANGVVNELGTLYNPLFIHSPVGLGKTHIIQAIGHKVLEKNPALNIKYLPSETFFNQYYLSLQKKEVEQFRDYYRSVDLLLIDDVQFIAGKEGFQTVFFHVFNELHQANKQIIITSDKPPKDLLGVAERLVSRFEWGMVMDIPKPDLEDRISITRDKVERLKILLSDSQVERIAKTVDTNVREIEGVLNQAKARAALNPAREVTSESLDKILSPFTKGKESSFTSHTPINPDSIIQAVCKLFSLQKTDILGNSRQKDVALARQLTFWFYKNELDLSYPTIGKLLGGRDHTTIMHGYKKIDKLVGNKDRKIVEKIQLTKKFLHET